MTYPKNYGIDVRGIHHNINFEKFSTGYYEYYSVNGFIIKDKILEISSKHSLMCFNFSLGGWILACADDYDTMPAQAILLEDSNIDEYHSLLIKGSIVSGPGVGDWLFSNNKTNLYLSADIPGNFVITPPNLDGTFVQQIGIGFRMTGQIYFDFQPLWIYNVDYM